MAPVRDRRLRPARRDYRVKPENFYGPVEIRTPATGPAESPSRDATGTDLPALGAGLDRSPRLRWLCAVCGVRRSELDPKYVMVVSGDRVTCGPCYEAEHAPDVVVYPKLPTGAP